MNSFKETPNLDLPESLFNEIKLSVDQNNIDKSLYQKTKKDGIGWINKISYKYSFKQGGFYIYRLDPVLEQKVLDYYTKFIELVGEVPKVRLKITDSVKQLPVHSDIYNGAGDKSSIITLIKGTNECTNWYQGDSNFKFTIWNLFKLKKIDSIIFAPGKSYFFNNDRLHNVTNVTPNTKRFLLAVSWKDRSIADLEKFYKLYDFDH
jgi:hypothetical protein